MQELLYFFKDGANKDSIYSGLKPLLPEYPLTPALMPGLKTLQTKRALAQNVDLLPIPPANFTPLPPKGG